MTPSYSLNRAGLWLALALLSSTGATQTGAESPFGEVVEVELVNVEVWVLDRQGTPVTGLTAGDFSVLHDDRAVELTHFTEVRDGEPHPAAATVPSLPPLPSPLPGPTEPLDRTTHLVVYVDQLRLHPSSYPAMIEGLTALLASESVAPERVLILRQDRRVFVEAPLGSSREELAAALSRLATSGAGGVDLTTETSQAFDAIQRAWRQSQEIVGVATSFSPAPAAGGPGGAPSGGTTPSGAVGGVGGGGGVGPDTCEIFLGRIEPIVDGWVRSRSDRIGVTLAHLAQTATLLGTVPGPKSLLYLSDGLDTQPGAALASYVTGLCPRGSSSVVMSAVSEELSRSLLGLTRLLNTHRVTVHSLQAGGLRSPRLSSAGEGSFSSGGAGIRGGGSFDAAARSAERAGLSLLAGETGGRSVFNRNDLAPELDRIGAETRNYYSLAYPLPAGDEGPEHRIEVRLRDETLVARYRRGYRQTEPAPWMAQRLQSALTLGFVDNPLDIRLGAGTLQGGEPDAYLLPLHVKVPAARLTFVPDGESRVAQVELAALCRNLRTEQLTSQQQRFRLRSSSDAEQEIVALGLTLELTAGEQAIAVGLRDEGSGRASFVTTSLEIGASPP